jgi:uncharacterized protein with HEPN domain
MPHDARKYLHDLADAARFLIGFTANRNFDEYLTDRGFRSAVERELITIGEAVLQIQKVDAAAADKITDHQRIVSFRNVLVHGYDSIKPDLVWIVVTDKLSILLQEVDALIASMGTE